MTKESDKMTESKINEIEINGVAYARKDSAAQPVPNGNRAVLVLDRGWVFCGDVTEENGRIRLDRAVHVRSWSSVGFDGMLDPKNADNVVIKKLSNRVDFPQDAELFRCPVDDSWGM